MAHMYPRVLLDADVKSNGERNVFDALRDGLPDEWDAFHSASIMVRDAAHGAQDDETDFVLCHPERGIVSLEVKGGGLECNRGEWFRLDRSGGRERMRDPFGQALDHRYELARKIAQVEGWRRRKLFVVHALAFPDITVHELVLAPDAPPQLVIDRNGIKDVAASIDEVLAYHEGSRDKRELPGAEGAAMLRDLLVPQVRIEVPLATTFDEEEHALVLLTREQSTLLVRMDRDRRMVVTGCAGSGKTMLGLERARRLAVRGRHVLFVCFNKALAKHVRDTVAIEGLDVFTFHKLCTHWAKRAGVELPMYEDPAPASFWNVDAPLGLMEAMESAGGQYDDLVVDEAQDLRSDWLEAVRTTLRDEASGSIWLFMDDNQRIFHADLEVPAEFRPFDLTVNCRNTQAIHHEVMKHYRGAIVPDVQGPPGRELELLHTDDAAATVAEVVERLCGPGGVSAREVVVLSSHGREKSAVFAAGAGRLRFTDRRGGGRDAVYFSSIRGFKGLESPVVVLCELEDLDEATRDQQLYVGISRARNHCVVVAPSPA